MMAVSKEDRLIDGFTLRTWRNEFGEAIRWDVFSESGWFVRTYVSEENALRAISRRRGNSIYNEPMHDNAAHFLLSPLDLYDHITRDHGVPLVDLVLPDSDENVKGWMERKRIESTGDLELDELMMWHEEAHGGALE